MVHHTMLSVWVLSMLLSQAVAVAVTHGHNCTALHQVRKIQQIRKLSHPVYPDLFLLGALKCATTSLYDLLIQHQDVCHARNKEVHFFDDHSHYRKGASYYGEHFYTPTCHKNYIDVMLCLTLLCSDLCPCPLSLTPVPILLFWALNCLTTSAPHPSPPIGDS
jgi:hypothetical protein